MKKPLPKPQKIELDYDYDLDGKNVGKLTMRPPKVKDGRQATKAAPGKEPEDVEVQLFANLTDTTFEFICELYQEDYNKIQEAYLDFLPSQKTKLTALLSG